MRRIAVETLIRAELEDVFQAVAHIESFPEIVTDVKRIEFLSQSKGGVGTRFRETREAKGKETVMDFEVTEYAPNQHIRMITDSHGSVWDSIFSVEKQADQTRLKIVMDARPHKLLPKLMFPLFKGFFKKGLEDHLTAVKTYLEA